MLNATSPVPAFRLAPGRCPIFRSLRTSASLLGQPAVAAAFAELSRWRSRVENIRLSLSLTDDRHRASAPVTHREMDGTRIPYLRCRAAMGTGNGGCQDLRGAPRRAPPQPQSVSRQKGAVRLSQPPVSRHHRRDAHSSDPTLQRHDGRPVGQGRIRTRAVVVQHRDSPYDDAPWTSARLDSRTPTGRGMGRRTRHPRLAPRGTTPAIPSCARRRAPFATAAAGPRRTASCPPGSRRSCRSCH